MKRHAMIASLLIALPLTAQERAKVGDKIPDFSFPQFLNGDGRQSIKEFFGQPVMIDRWGTR